MVWFKDAMIVTMDEQAGVIHSGHLVTDGEKIVYVGKDEPKLIEKAEVINCQNQVIMPGLYNAHTHVPMTLLRSYGEELPLDRWLNERIFPAEDKLDADAVKWGAQLSMAEMLASGTVSFSDMYFFSDTIIEAAIEAKIKGNVSQALVCFDEATLKDSGRLDSAMRLYREYHNRENERIKVDMAMHAIYTSNREYIKMVSEETAHFDGMRHIHLSETEKENVNCLARYQKTPTQVLFEAGWLKKPVLAAHCVHLTDADRAILSQCGVHIAHNPTSNLKLGSGIADVDAMLKVGISVALGTDGCASNNNLNMFEEMHLCALVPKGLSKDPTKITAKETLTMATRNGAKAQGRDDCGMLKEGMRADLICIDFDRPHLTPNPDPLFNLVYCAQAADVVLTMVDGEVLYKNGEFLTLDIEKIKAEARRCAKKITAQE